MPVVSSGITCSLCGIAITDDIKALHCDRDKCEQWKCIDCLNISADVYDHLIPEAASSLRWFCEGCDKVVMSQTTVVHHEEADRIDNLVSVAEKLVAKCIDVEDKLRNKGDHSMMLQLDTRIRQLENQFQRQEKDLEARLAAADASITDKMREFKES